MNRYAALLRGVNLGSRNRVPMAELRAVLSARGLAEVRTHLQSGNVVFGSGTGPDAVAREIENAVRDTFGFSVACLIRSRDELHAVIDRNPLTEVSTDGSKLMAWFLSDHPEPALLAEHDPVALDPDRIRIGDRVIYQWCPNGLMGAPAVGEFAEKHLKLTVTARNWNTVTKLGSLLDG